MSTLAFEIPGIAGSVLPALQLRRILGNALTCVSNDETIPVLNCVLITVSEDEMTVMSTDRYCLVRERVRLESSDSQEWQAMVAAEDVRLLREALGSGLKGCESKEELSSVLAFHDGRVYLTVADVRMDVGTELELTPITYEPILRRALDARPADCNVRLSPFFLGRLSKIVGPFDEAKYRQPVDLRWAGDRTPLLFTWENSELLFLLMPVVHIDEPVPDGDEGEVKRREATLRDAGHDFLRHGYGFFPAPPEGVDPGTGEIS